MRGYVHHHRLHDRSRFDGDVHLDGEQSAGVRNVCGDGWASHAPELYDVLVSDRFAVGDVDGEPHDELFFGGPGLVVVDIVDFGADSGTMLDPTPHGAVVVDEAGGQGSGSLIAATDDAVELWTSNGIDAAPVFAESLSIGCPSRSLAVREPGASAVALCEDGLVVLLTTGGSLAVEAEEPIQVGAIRVFGGPIDDDAIADVVAIDTNGNAWVWLGA
jgi:hypothetical protein